jgi:ribosome-binding factor A
LPDIEQRDGLRLAATRYGAPGGHKSWSDIVESGEEANHRQQLPMSKDRMRRVNEAVREVLSTAIGQDLKDPRVGFVTVTAVDTSPDLRSAHVYVSVFGDEHSRTATLTGLSSSRGYLQGRVASELRLKHTPQLDFRYDESIERGIRISELLRQEETSR